MDEAALLARMAEQRTRWVDLPDGKRVQFRRPVETELPRFREGVTIEHVCEYVCGWSGFTEADLLGPAVGASDAVPFTPRLWAEIVRDRIDYMQPVATGIVQAITQHLADKDKAAKN